MSSSLAYIILSLTLLGLSLGCQKTPEAWNPSKPFRTQVVVGTSKGIEFQVVELEGVKDQRTLKGDVVEFFLSPGEKNSEIVGRSAIARFVQDSNGVHIPVNSLSLQMVSLYFHMQSLKKLEVEALGKAFVKWPRQIGLRVKTNNPETRFNNAFYNNKLDVMFFVPYAEDELPIPMNGGIIAHEHFHSYFSYGVLQKLGSQKNEPLQDFVMKSVNEGLADVWGWIYSGDPDFISLSLPGLSGMRKLETPSFMQSPQVKSKADLEFEVKLAESECELYSWCKSPEQISTSMAYVNGTTLARILKNFLTRQTLNQKEKAQKIFALIDRIHQLSVDNSLDIEKMIVEWSKLFTTLSLQDCEFLKNSVKTKEIQDQICINI